jgi:hypothetical protein
MNWWLIGGSLLYLGGSAAWKKYVNPPLPKGPPQRYVDLPRADEGAPIPIIYGQCRVRAPIIAWTGTPHFMSASSFFTLGDITIPASGDLYFLSMMLVLGMPFEGGTTKVLKMWQGEQRFKPYAGLGIPNLVDLPALVGDGGFEDDTRRALMQTMGGDQGSFAMGDVEFLNGGPTQQLVDPVTPYGAHTVAGRYMTVNNGTGPADLQGDQNGRFVPGYRQFASVFLYNKSFGGSEHWCIGPAPQVPAYSFEVSSYPAQGAGALTSYNGIGVDANPVDVIYDVLKAKLGRLGLDPNTQIDVQSFITAAVTCYSEGNGYSRSVEQEMTAAELIGEVLKQINGVVYLNQQTQQITIKLIRADYNPLTIQQINNDNCDSFHVEAVGWQDLPNKIRVTFNNRANDYAPDSVAVQDLASVTATGKVREERIDMPGVCDKTNAYKIAGRELAELSRPLMTATAMVARSFLRVNPGDAVRVTLSNPDVAGIVFRVVGVDRGTLTDGKIRLDLVQDSFDVWRDQTPTVKDWTTLIKNAIDNVVTLG